MSPNAGGVCKAEGTDGRRDIWDRTLVGAQAQYWQRQLGVLHQRPVLLDSTCGRPVEGKARAC